MVQDNRIAPRPRFVIHENIDWLAGAAAGLRYFKSREPHWRWKPFLDEVTRRIEEAEIVPLSLGKASQLADLFLGSLFDLAGGYISITGEMLYSGLVVPVSFADALVLSRLFSHFKVCKLGVVLFNMDTPHLSWAPFSISTIKMNQNDQLLQLFVPPNYLQHFLALFPISGPVAEDLWEVLG